MCTDRARYVCVFEWCIAPVYKVFICARVHMYSDVRKLHAHACVFEMTTNSTYNDPVAYSEESLIRVCALVD